MITLSNIEHLIAFDEVAHTYTRLLDGKELTGVTTMLKKMGLSADYAAVAEETLIKAADRGQMIHRLCDITDNEDREVSEFDEIEVHHDLTEKGIVRLTDAATGMREANDYHMLRKQGEYIPVAQEYLISDGENIASAIDIVLTTETLAKENKVILVDLKCTSQIHETPLSWQLSVYRELFEHQNPDLKVEKVMCVWLPKPQYGSSKMIEVSEHSSKDVDTLINSFVMGKPLVLGSETENTAQFPKMQQLLTVIREMNALKDIETQLRQELMTWMTDKEIKSYSTDEVLVSRTVDSVTKKFDSTAFKKDNPSLYEKYVKASEKKGSLTIRFK